MNLNLWVWIQSTYGWKNANRVDCLNLCLTSDFIPVYLRTKEMNYGL